MKYSAAEGVNEGTGKVEIFFHVLKEIDESPEVPNDQTSSIFPGTEGKINAKLEIKVGKRHI